MRRPLLTIAIPTYNRPENLADLHGTLKPLLRRFGPKIDIVVCDNSDSRAAAINSEIVRSPARYIKNSVNLGFAGNVLKCSKVSLGEYLWLLSDNDALDLDRTVELIEHLEALPLSSRDALLVPYEVPMWSGRITVRNSAAEWGYAPRIPLPDLLSTAHDIPFIFLSSAIIRIPTREKDAIVHALEESWLDNDFVQIPLFVSLIGRTGFARVYEKPIVRYRVEHVRRFDLYHMQLSLDRVVDWLVDEGFNVSHLTRASLRRWLALGLHQHIGLTRVAGFDRFRRRATRQALSNPQLGNLLLLAALWTPSVLISWPYLLWLSLSEWRTTGQSNLKQLLELRANLRRSGHQ